MKTKSSTHKTLVQLRKEANNAPKYVLHSDQFGNDIYVADESLCNGGQLTDNIAEALVYSVGYDNELLKVGYWKAVTGLDLKVKKL